MTMHRQWLWWMARILGVFPLTELRPRRRRRHPGGHLPPGAEPAAKNSVFPEDFRAASPRRWAADFSTKARRQEDVQPMLLRRSAFWLCYSVVQVSAVLGYTVYATMDDFAQGEEATGVRWVSRTDQYATLCEYLSLCSATMVSAICAWVCGGSVVRHSNLLAKVSIIC